MGAMGIAKGLKQRALAEKCINYSLAVAPQKLNAETMYIGPTNRGVQLARRRGQARALRRQPRSASSLPTGDEFGKRRDQWVERWNRGDQIGSLAP